ncbi:hypothetical protein RCH23_002119 [Cryobacterium sp. CAN_C3]|nr:hypothetical protein [Cryobacterium sp. CAN_C3]
MEAELGARTKGVGTLSACVWRRFSRLQFEPELSGERAIALLVEELNLGGLFLGVVERMLNRVNMTWSRIKSMKTAIWDWKRVGRGLPLRPDM